MWSSRHKKAKIVPLKSKVVSLKTAGVGPYKGFNADYSIPAVLTIEEIEPQRDVLRKRIRDNFKTIDRARRIQLEDREYHPTRNLSEIVGTMERDIFDYNNLTKALISLDSKEHSCLMYYTGRINSVDCDSTNFNNYQKDLYKSFYPLGFGKTYKTLDNGSRPFKVVITGKTAKVYFYGKAWKTFKFKKAFIGRNVKSTNSKSNSYKFKAFLGNTILLNTSGNRYIYIGSSVFEFTTKEPIVKLIGQVGNNDVPYPYALTKRYVYLLLEPKYAEIKKINELIKKRASKKDYKLRSSGIKQIPIDIYNLYYGHVKSLKACKKLFKKYRTKKLHKRRV